MYLPKAEKTVGVSHVRGVCTANDLWFNQSLTSQNRDYRSGRSTESCTQHRTLGTASVFNTVLHDSYYHRFVYSYNHTSHWTLGTAFARRTSNIAISARASSKSQPKSACVTPAWHRISLPASPQGYWKFIQKSIFFRSHRIGFRVDRVAEISTACRVPLDRAFQLAQNFTIFILVELTSRRSITYSAPWTFVWQCE